MSLRDLIGLAIGCATLLGVAWKLLGAWTAKAVAEAQSAEQLKELRTSHAKFMERMEAAEKQLRDADVRRDERRRLLTDPRGLKADE